MRQRRGRAAAGIAIAKAFTANAFSTDTLPLSTARLYTLSQPGHSLWGAGAGNPINPECLATPGAADTGVGKVCGGTIVFGGGLAFYKGQTRVGGLGVSGDTSCADHEIAKRVRDAAGLNPPDGRSADDIVYTSKDGPSPFAHPLCANTWRNGKKSETRRRPLDTETRDSGLGTRGSGPATGYWRLATDLHTKLAASSVLPFPV